MSRVGIFVCNSKLTKEYLSAKPNNMSKITHFQTITIWWGYPRRSHSNTTIKQLGVKASENKLTGVTQSGTRIASASTSHKTWAADSAAARVLASVRFFPVNARDARPGGTVM